MDRQVRAEQDWESVNLVLLRQFGIRSAVSLIALGFVLIVAQQDRGVIVDAMTWGGWMVVNCLGIVWMGAKALRYSHAHAERYVAGFVAIVLGLLAVGAWLVVARRPSLLGLTGGFMIPLAVFLYQLRRLRVKISSHAR